MALLCEDDIFRQSLAHSLLRSLCVLREVGQDYCLATEQKVERGGRSKLRKVTLR